LKKEREDRKNTREQNRDRELIMGMDQASMPLYINSALPNTQTKKNKKKQNKNTQTKKNNG
jgi:hypothetical protein